jgi:signal peptidase II
MKTASRLLALVLVLTTIGCDRVTKHLATTHLADSPPRSYFADTLRIEYAENTGAFLGIGGELPDSLRTSLLQIGVGVALAALAVVALRRNWQGVQLIGASLAFSGGLSNLLDRIARDRVVDFLNVGLGPLRTGIFNVADVAILAGMVLIAFGDSHLSLAPGRRNR